MTTSNILEQLKNEQSEINDLFITAESCDEKTI